MSLRSMTGHGHGEASGQGLKITAELSSVNRRQLEIHLTLPRNLGVLEARCQEEIHRAVSRGRINGEVYLKWTSGANRSGFRLDEELAEDYLAALRKTARRLKLKDDFNGSVLLNLPNVFQPTDLGDNLEARVWPVLEKALRLALKQLTEMKTHEGRALEKDLESRINLLERQLRAIKKQAPQVTRRYREALRSRIRQAGLETDPDDPRLVKEIAFFADRSDITEEITRLESHLDQGRRLLKSGNTTGKTLDFLAQEMFREINTIGAKANDAAVLKQVVAFKTELERIREQVQNLE